MTEGPLTSYHLTRCLQCLPPELQTWVTTMKGWLLNGTGESNWPKHVHITQMALIHALSCDSVQIEKMKRSCPATQIRRKTHSPVMEPLTMGFLKYLTQSYNPRSKAMSMPWPDVDGRFTCFYNGEWHDLFTLGESERMLLLYPWRSDTNLYLDRPEDKHAVILTGSNQKGDWAPYVVWKREDYLLKFAGDRDPPHLV